MNLLVTGAAGFIGRNLMRSLPSGWRVTATCLDEEDFPDFLQHHARCEALPFRVDLTDPQAVARLRSVSASFDACVFLAANGDPAVSVERPAFDLRSNTLTVVNLLENVRFGRLIYFSSGAVYDRLHGPVSPQSQVNPRLPYAISKLASERYLEHFREAGCVGDVWAVRFFGAYGPFEPQRKIYGRLVRRFAFERNPRFVIRGDGQNLIDAMYIDDAVRAIHKLLETPERGATVDLSCAEPLTLTELVSKAAAAFGLEAEISYEGIVPEYIQFYSVDEAMRQRCGFRPAVPLSEGLHRFAAHLQSGA
jgi:nucleoside-diphosphate-sugar epimerase